MKANCWMGTQHVEVRDVPDPQILNDRDCIVKITSTAICGSDLHLYNGFMPTMEKGDILGHEFMGEVVECGRAVKNLKVGDRVVNPFTISCGVCNACRAEAYSCCENSNPIPQVSEAVVGHPLCGFFGYSRLTGGFAGGQAQYARIPYADVGPLKIENGFSDEQVLFLSDILPTGYMAAEMCDIQPGDFVAVWGAGPVGLFAMASAKLLGAERVVAIDRFDYRLQRAVNRAGATDVINYEQLDGTTVIDALKELTGGRGPDKCIDAVGMEAHAPGLAYAYDRTKQALKLETDRPFAVREAIMACRSGGTVSIIGVYGGFADKFPLGSLMNRSITIKTGQTHVPRYMKPLLGRIERGEIDPTMVISHVLPLADAPKGYDMFVNKKDGCEKVVLKA
jgi:threonine dehydrogenase-like Zn-dependent dehydrogenase